MNSTFHPLKLKLQSSLILWLGFVILTLFVLANKAHFFKAVDTYQLFGILALVCALTYPSIALTCLTLGNERDLGPKRLARFNSLICIQLGICIALVIWISIQDAPIMTIENYLLAILNGYFSALLYAKALLIFGLDYWLLILIFLSGNRWLSKKWGPNKVPWLGH